MGGGGVFPHSRWRGLRKIKDGNILPSFFNNGIKGVGMGGFQDAAAVVLVAGGVGGNMLENKYVRMKKYTWKWKTTTSNMMTMRKMKTNRTTRYLFPAGY